MQQAIVSTMVSSGAGFCPSTVEPELRAFVAQLEGAIDSVRQVSGE